MPTLQPPTGTGLALFRSARRFGLPDLLVVAALAGLLYASLDVLREWTGPLRPAVAIDLSPWALPVYTLYSLSRGLVAYVVSLAFTLAYGYWAAKDRVAEKLLIPLLDILQSIPVLGFMPGLVLALVALFPTSNVGLELAAIIMIFTGQAWNMTFGFYHSLRSVPNEWREVASVFRFSWWEGVKWVELPCAAISLVWNSMMSMAGGWFFLTINEAFQLGDRDFRLPGIGAYMSVAIEEGQFDAMMYAIVAMTAMIVFLDQVLWRPVVVWAQKFRIEEGGAQESASSWLIELFRGSRMLRALAFKERSSAWLPVWILKIKNRGEKSVAGRRFSAGFARLPFVLLVGVLAYGAWKLLALLAMVSASDWIYFVGLGILTLLRVLAATALGTCWAVPAGLAIGLSPRLARVLQPMVQVVASFPAPMLFPLVILAMRFMEVSLNFTSIVLMLLGTQWYILFNVIAGAMAVPADLREAARSFRLPLLQRMRTLYLPAVFPYLVTGWVTAAGGAWNASIVSEFVTMRGETMQTLGLGAAISNAAERADFPALAAGILVMSVLVVTFNRLVWKRCYHIAQTRYSLEK